MNLKGEVPLDPRCSQLAIGIGCADGPVLRSECLAKRSQVQNWHSDALDTVSHAPNAPIVDDLDRAVALRGLESGWWRAQSAMGGRCCYNALLNDQARLIAACNTSPRSRPLQLRAFPRVRRRARRRPFSSQTAWRLVFLPPLVILIPWIKGPVCAPARPRGLMSELSIGNLDPTPSNRARSALMPSHTPGPAEHFERLQGGVVVVQSWSKTNTLAPAARSRMDNAGTRLPIIELRHSAP